MTATSNDSSPRMKYLLGAVVAAGVGIGALLLDGPDLPTANRSDGGSPIPWDDAIARNLAREWESATPPSTEPNAFPELRRLALTLRPDPDAANAEGMEAGIGAAMARVLVIEGEASPEDITAVRRQLDAHRETLTTLRNLLRSHPACFDWPETPDDRTTQPWPRIQRLLSLAATDIALDAREEAFDAPALLDAAYLCRWAMGAPFPRSSWPPTAPRQAASLMRRLAATSDPDGVPMGTWSDAATVLGQALTRARGPVDVLREAALHDLTTVNRFFLLAAQAGELPDDPAAQAALGETASALSRVYSDLLARSEEPWKQLADAIALTEPLAPAGAIPGFDPAFWGSVLRDWTVVIVQLQAAHARCRYLGGEAFPLVPDPWSGTRLSPETRSGTVGVALPDGHPAGNWLTLGRGR